MYMYIVFPSVQGNYMNLPLKSNQIRKRYKDNSFSTFYFSPEIVCDSIRLINLCHLWYNTLLRWSPQDRGRRQGHPAQKIIVFLPASHSGEILPYDAGHSQEIQRQSRQPCVSYCSYGIWFIVVMYYRKCWHHFRI